MSVTTSDSVFVWGGSQWHSPVAIIWLMYINIFLCLTTIYTKSYTAAYLNKAEQRTVCITFCHCSTQLVQHSIHHHCFTLDQRFPPTGRPRNTCTVAPWALLKIKMMMNSCSIFALLVFWPLEDNMLCVIFISHLYEVIDMCEQCVTCKLSDSISHYQYLIKINILR